MTGDPFAAAPEDKFPDVGFNPFDVPPAGAAEEPEEETDDVLPPGARVVHVTEIERFLECGHRHAMYASRTWVEGDAGPRTRGSAVHKAREHAFRAFMKSGALPATSDLEAVAAAEVRELMKGAEDLGEGDQVDAVVDETVAFVRADAALLLPSIAPHVFVVEPKMIEEISGEGIEPQSWFLSGRPDSVGRDPTTGKLVLPDLKTGSKATPQAALNTSSQLTGYAFLAQRRYGEIPILAHHSLRILKRAPKPKPGQTTAEIRAADGSAVLAVAERLRTERSDEDLATFVRRLNVFVSSQQAGVALPATASNFMSPCHRCAHRGHVEESQRCPFVPAFRGGEGEEVSDE